MQTDKVLYQKAPQLVKIYILLGGHKDNFFIMILNHLEKNEIFNWLSQ